MAPGQRDASFLDAGVVETRVLVVEDDPGLLPVLASVVEGFGFEVRTARDGREAWERLRAEHCSIVLTDWIMPEMDGLELVRAIRSRVETANLWVVMLTGQSDDQAFAQGMDAGVDDFLTKPWRPEELGARLKVARRHTLLQEQLEQTNRVLRRSNRELELYHARVSRELEAAARVQRALLPGEVEPWDGVDIAWSLRPCEELAGDILNVMRLTEDRLGVYVLDVSGHGVSAALLSAQVGRLLGADPSQSRLLCRGRGRYRQPVAPIDVVRQLNDLFPMDPQRPQFFTLVYGVFEVDTGRFVFSSAGHPGPVVVRADGRTEEFVLPGTPVGMLQVGRWDQCDIVLQPGDHVALISDGVVEAESPDGEVFGTDRLRSALSRADGGGAQAQCLEALAAVESWVRPARPRDDCSILVVGRSGGPG
jgi:sigma-B regulation protein RsbU (phosphoserine phosphatase)